VLGFMDALRPILLKDSFCVILPAQYLINRFSRQCEFSLRTGSLAYPRYSPEQLEDCLSRTGCGTELRSTYEGSERSQPSLTPLRKAQ